VANADVFGALAACGEEDFRGGGVGVFFEEMMLRSPNVVEADFVGEFDLVESILEGSMIGVAAPGTRELMLVEAAKFHASSSYNALRGGKKMARLTSDSSGGR
jgi:hypothetical protein